MSLFPNYVLQFFDNNGDPLSGGKLFFYEPGGTTKKDTTDGSGGAVNPNPIILDSAGRPDNSGTPIDIHLIDGETYKIVLAPSTDSDPPVNPIRTTNNLVDLTGSGQWVNTKTPTYANATQFTLVGNQTADYTVGRRVKTIGGADRYSRISISSYAAPTTTITVVDTRDSSGGAQSLHASMTSASTHLITPDGLRGAMLIEGIADATGTVDAITATFYPAIALSDKVTVMVRASGANTITTPTFAPDGVTAKTIVKNNNAALGAGDIAGADHVLILQYNSTNDNWNLLNAIAVANQATEEARGSAEIATQAEMDAGADDLKIATPLKIKAMSAIIGQTALNTTTAENTTTISIGLVTLTGGQYTFLVESRHSSGGGDRVYTYGGDSSVDTNVSTNSTSYIANMTMGEEGTGTAYMRHRYFLACPPYNLGDGDIPLFAFVALHKTTGEIISTSIGIEAPWHNNGPTSIRPNKVINGIKCRKQKDMTGIPFSYIEAKQDVGKLREYICAIKEAKTIYEPITQELKQRDMSLIPSPFVQFIDKSGNDITKDTVTVMLDPVCDLTHELAGMLEHKDFSLGELLHDGMFKIDNTPCGRCGPPGVLVPAYRWK